MLTQKDHLLHIVKYQLFGGERPATDGCDLPKLLQEAQMQAVFLTVFPAVQGELKRRFPQEYAGQLEAFHSEIIKCTNNFSEHAELHRLMTENGVPYCTLKGAASAYYYPDTSLRIMGDVDYLVYEKDFERAKQLVLGQGFAVDHGDDAQSKHVALKRRPFSIWEQHRSFNTPEGAVGKRIGEEIGSVIETAHTVSVDVATCRIPDDFHHGLIMLLHVIAHMTGEGIGLRHLCDWAVFAHRLDNETFVRLFEKKLKAFGLWKFAQILTLVSEKYLGIAHRAWAQNPGVTDAHLEDVMDDILKGGNFGYKDRNRYREIKYIANRGTSTVDDKNVLAQVFGTLNEKTRGDYPWANRHRALLPIGWLAEGGRYAGLLISGKRKSEATYDMLREAAKRKSIYSQMRLFEEEL